MDTTALKLVWSAGVRTTFKGHPAVLRKATPTEAFWTVWRANKEEAKKAGYLVTKEGTAWVVKHFELVDLEKHREAEQKAREAAIAAAQLSRATDADVALPVPEGLSYLGYQKAGIAFAMDRDAALIGDEMGLGKAQPLDARILTPNGWTTMGELKIGDVVIGSDGRPTRVSGVFPQGQKEVFRVTFSDGSQTECCDDHLWSVNTALRRWRKKEGRVADLREIRGSLFDATGNRRHFIPVVQAVAFEPRELPIDPYLLGVLLGDGGIKHHYVRFSTADKEIVESVKAAIPMTLRVKHEGDYDYSIVSAYTGLVNIIRRKLNYLGLAGKGSDDKFVPGLYLVASIDQRIALLQGLLDTDGYVSEDSVVQFSSNSKVLAENVVEIVRSLGGIARLTTKISSSNKDHWIVTLCLPEGIIPFRLTRKANRYKPRMKYRPARAFDKVESIGLKECQCISVEADDHLYVTDDYVVTHNTIQGIGVANATGGRKILIVCPASLRINWMRELEKWLVDKTLTIAIADTKKGWPDADVVIVNYDILKRFHAQLRAIEWDLIIADEAHYLKNQKAQRTVEVVGRPEKYVKGKKQEAVTPLKAKRRVFLTGTPILNRPIELWPLLSYLDPKNWNHFFRFASRYCAAYNNGYGWDFSGKSNLDELQQKLRETIMVRRLKRDVLKELPAKTRQIITLPANGASKAIDAERKAIEAYEDRLFDLRVALELAKASEDDGAYERAAAKLRAETRAAFDEIAKKRHETAVAKVPYVVEHLLNAGEKIVVFAHHKDVIASIRQGLEAEGRKVVTVTGDMSKEARQEAIDAFQTGDATDIIGTFGAMSVGYTLTASSHVVFAEIDWTPGIMSQAEDRAHRIGQINAVLVQHIVLDGSIDANLVQTIVGKQKIIDEALDIEHARIEPKPSEAPISGTFDVDAATKKAAEEIAKRAAEEAKNAPVAYGHDRAASEDLTRATIVADADKLDPTVVHAVHQCLRTLAALDTDRAMELNGIGFNKIDSKIGADLAFRETLTPRQAVLGKKIIKKYHRQLPAHLYDAVFAK